MTTEVRFDRMVPSMVVERREACSLAYLPVGALEWHGPHMPFGTDFMTVNHLAEQTAERFGGVVFPPMYYGDNRYYLIECMAGWRKTYAREMKVPEQYASRFGLEYHKQRNDLRPPPDDGTPAEHPLDLSVEGSERAFVDLIARTLISVHLYGFRNILMLCGHGGNPPYCERAEEVYRQNVRCKKAFGPPAKTRTWCIADGGFETEPLLKNHWIHADKWEGSLTMAAEPGTVHPELLPDGPDTLTPAYLGGPYIHEDRGYNPEYAHLRHSIDALHPRNINEDYGRRQVEGLVEELRKVVEGLMAGGSS